MRISDWSSDVCSSDEFAYQRQAYAQAVSHPDVVGIMPSGFERSIAVALMEWGGPASMHPIVDWTLIADAEDAAGFAEAVTSAPRRAFGWHSPGSTSGWARGCQSG